MKTETNSDGYYKLSNIVAGYYDVEIVYNEVYNFKLKSVQVKNGTLLPLNNVVFEIKNMVKKRKNNFQNLK